MFHECKKHTVRILYCTCNEMKKFKNIKVHFSLCPSLVIEMYVCRNERGGGGEMRGALGKGGREGGGNQRGPSMGEM